MPKADATGLAPKKSADHNPPAQDSSVREGCGFGFRSRPSPRALLPARHRAEPENQKPISLVKSPSGGLGLYNAQTARPLLPGAPNRGSSSFFRWDTNRAYAGEYPIPSRTHSGDTLRWAGRKGREEIRLTTSGKTILRRYTLAAQPPTQIPQHRQTSRPRSFKVDSIPIGPASAASASGLVQTPQ